VILKNLVCSGTNHPGHVAWWCLKLWCSRFLAKLYAVLRRPLIFQILSSDFNADLEWFLRAWSCVDYTPRKKPLFCWTWDFLWNKQVNASSNSTEKKRCPLSIGWYQRGWRMLDELVSLKGHSRCFGAVATSWAYSSTLTLIKLTWNYFHDFDPFAKALSIFEAMICNWCESLKKSWPLVFRSPHERGLKISKKIKGRVISNTQCFLSPLSLFLHYLHNDLFTFWFTLDATHP
jgi:hypothetical protein